MAYTRQDLSNVGRLSTQLANNRLANSLPDVSVSPMYAAGEAFAAGLGDAGTDVRQWIDGVKTFIDINWIPPETLNEALSAKYYVDLAKKSAVSAFDPKAAGIPEEDMPALNKASQDIIGEPVAALFDVAFAPINAGFAFINQADDNQKSILSPFISLMNFNMELLAEPFSVPKSTEEYDERAEAHNDMRAQSFIGEWVAKVRGWSMAAAVKARDVGGNVGGLLYGQKKEDESMWEYLNSPFVMDNIDDYRYANMVDSLTEILPAIAVIKGFGPLTKAEMALGKKALGVSWAGTKKLGSLTKKVAPTAGKVALGAGKLGALATKKTAQGLFYTTKQAWKVFHEDIGKLEKPEKLARLKEAAVEVVDTKQNAELLMEVHKAVKAKDTAKLEEIAKKSPRIIEKYNEIESSKNSGIETIKSILRKSSDGTKLTKGEKSFFVKWFANHFEGTAGVTKKISALATKAKQSLTKFELYEDVMQEISTTTLAHPKVLDALGLKKGMTQLKEKAPKSFEDRGKFAQMEGAEGPKKPTGEAAKQRVKKRQAPKPYLEDVARKAKSKSEFLNSVLDVPMGNIKSAVPKGEIKKKLGKVESRTPDSPVIVEVKNGELVILDGNQRYYQKLERGDKTIKARFTPGQGAEAFYDQVAKSKVSEGAKAEARKAEELADAKGFQEFLDSEPEVGKKIQEGKDLTDKEFSNPKAQKAIIDKMKSQKIEDFNDLIKEEAVKNKDIPKEIKERYLEDKTEAFNVFDHLWSPLNVLVGKVLSKGVGKRALETATRWAVKEQKVTSEYTNYWNDIGAVLNLSKKEFMTSQIKLLAASKKIFHALDKGKIDALEAKLKPIAEKLKAKFEEFKKETIKHEKEMIDYRTELKKEAEARVKELNDAIYELEADAPGINALKSQRNSWESFIEDVDLSNYKSRDVLKRMEEKGGIKNYIPHIIDPLYLDLIREQFPELYNKMQAGALRMEVGFLKEREGAHFVMEDAISAAHYYERVMQKKLTYEKMAEEMRFDALNRGHHDQTLKGKFTRDFIDQVINEKRRGREAYFPLAEKIVGTMYGAFNKMKEYLDSDLELAARMLERKVEISDKTAKFMKENALDPEAIRIEMANGKNILTVNSVKADYLAFDRMITGMKKFGYAGTIGMSLRTTMLNLITQPMLSLAYSGLSGVEGMKIIYEAYREGFKLWKLGEEGKALRQEMIDKAMSLDSNRLTSPERGVSAQTKGVVNKALDATLANMTYTEFVARYVAGYIGQKAYEAGKITKAEYGEMVEIGGQKLSKGWADTYNFQYIPEHMSMLAGGSPIGRAVFFLNTFSVKNLELHKDLYKKAEFIDWMKKSEEIVKNKELDATAKAMEIMKEYGKNKERMGFGKEAAYGLTLAMVFGQVFDIDWNEFMFQVQDLSISNPMTNILFGAGGWNQDLIDKTKPFIPLRGGIRSLDKASGADVFSDYRDYGNVPQIPNPLKK